MYFLGFLVSGLFIYWGFRNVPLSEIYAYFRHAEYILVGCAIGLLFLSFLLRAVRWQTLLGKKESLSNCFHILMASFMLNCVLPARAGEIARPVMVSRNPDVSLLLAVCSQIAERVLDLVVILLLLGISMAVIRIPADVSYTFNGFVLNRDLLMDSTSKFILLLAAGLSALFIIGFMGRKKRFQNKLMDKINLFRENLLKGLEPVLGIRKFLAMILLSLIIWIFQAGSFYLVAAASPAITIDFLQTIFVMVVILFFIALPSVPGFWGLWEAGGIFAMMVLGISKTDAAGFNLFNHAIQLIPVILAGIVSAFVLGTRFISWFSRGKTSPAGTNQQG